MKRFINIRLLYFIILLFTFHFAIAQKTVQVQNAKGISYLSDDITLNQTKEKALEEAKKDALRKAGVSEHISESNVLYSLSQEKDFKQFFNSISTIEISGAITKTENIRYEKQKEQVTGKEFMEATIDVEVIKYEKKSDPSFDFEVNEIAGKYKINDALKFTFQPFADGYLHVFQINRKEASQLFPNKFESSKIFSKNQLIKFPLNKGIEYSLDSKSENEMNTVVFVYTKKEIPFTSKQDYESIIKWIYSISPDERRIKNFDFMVGNN